MCLDFLARAYVPHLLLAVVAAAVCATQPPWPDESWATPYEPLRERTAAAAERTCREDRRQWQFDKDSPEWREVQASRRQAQEEWTQGREALRPVDQRLVEGRAAVLAALARRAALLTLLTLLCYLLTDSLVSAGDGLRLLADAPSFLWLLAGALVASLLAARIACDNPPLAAAVFLVCDGLSLTVLLFARDAYGHFAESRLEAERQEEMREAVLRGGTPGARREAEQFYAAHEDILRELFPPALWRASLNAAIPDDADPVEAWAAARKLIKQLQPHLAQAGEARREAEEGRKKRAAERRRLLGDIAHLKQQIDKVRASMLDADVIQDEVDGLQQKIARLEQQLAILDSLTDEGVNPR